MSSHWILTTKRVTVLLVITASFLRPSSAASRDGWTRTGPEGGSITALAIRDGIRPATLGAWETGSMLLRYCRASFVDVWNACGTSDRG